MRPSDTSPPTTNTTVEATPSATTARWDCSPPTPAGGPGTDSTGAGHDHQLDHTQQQHHHDQQPTANNPTMWSEQNRDLLQRVRYGSVIGEQRHRRRLGDGALLGPQERFVQLLGARIAQPGG